MIADSTAPSDSDRLLIHLPETRGMMINNTSPGRADRVNAKNLDQQLMQEMIQGLNCSPFEAEAIVEKVHEVFNPILEEAELQPGRVRIFVVSSSTPPNVPLSRAEQKLVTLTLYAGPEDVEIQRRYGVPALRQHRLVRMAEEAFQQGGLLTLEDLAAVFNCGLRTLNRDLAELRDKSVLPPLRSTVKDMGRAITHRRWIVQLWLKGLEYSQIARKTHHHVSSVAAYVDKFKRCAVLFSEAFDLNTVSFLVGISTSLVNQFYDLWCEADPVAHRRQELEDFTKKNRSELSQIRIQETR